MAKLNDQNKPQTDTSTQQSNNNSQQQSTSNQQSNDNQQNSDQNQPVAPNKDFSKYNREKVTEVVLTISGNASLGFNEDVADDNYIISTLGEVQVVIKDEHFSDIKIDSDKSLQPERVTPEIVFQTPFNLSKLLTKVFSIYNYKDYYNPGTPLNYNNVKIAKPLKSNDGKLPDNQSQEDNTQAALKRLGGYILRQKLIRKYNPGGDLPDSDDDQSQNNKQPSNNSNAMYAAMMQNMEFNPDSIEISVKKVLMTDSGEAVNNDDDSTDNQSTNVIEIAPGELVDVSFVAKFVFDENNVKKYCRGNLSEAQEVLGFSDIDPGEGEDIPETKGLFSTNNVFAKAVLNNAPDIWAAIKTRKMRTPVKKAALEKSGTQQSFSSTASYEEQISRALSQSASPEFRTGDVKSNLVENVARNQELLKKASEAAQAASSERQTAYGRKIETENRNRLDAVNTANTNAANLATERFDQEASNQERTVRNISNTTAIWKNLMKDEEELRNLLRPENMALNEENFNRIIAEIDGYIAKIDDAIAKHDLLKPDEATFNNKQQLITALNDAVNNLNNPSVTEETIKYEKISVLKNTLSNYLNSINSTATSDNLIKAIDQYLETYTTEFNLIQSLNNKANSSDKSDIKSEIQQAYQNAIKNLAHIRNTIVNEARKMLSEIPEGVGQYDINQWQSIRNQLEARKQQWESYRKAITEQYELSQRKAAATYGGQMFAAPEFAGRTVSTPFTSKYTNKSLDPRLFGMKQAYGTKDLKTDFITGVNNTANATGDFLFPDSGFQLNWKTPEERLKEQSNMQLRQYYNKNQGKFASGGTINNRFTAIDKLRKEEEKRMKQLQKEYEKQLRQAEKEYKQLVKSRKKEQKQRQKELTNYYKNLRKPPSVNPMIIV